MQYLTILLNFLAASTAASQIEESQIEERAAMDLSMQWCEAGGKVLTGINDMTTIVSNMITNINTASSCTIDTVTVTGDLNMTATDTFDFQHFYKEVMANATTHDGIWAYQADDQILQHDGTIEYDTGYMKSVNVSSQFVEFVTGAYSTSTLDARSTRLGSEIYVKYQASDTCKTAASAATRQAAVKKALDKMSSGGYVGAFFLMHYGGDWRGHLKMVDVSTLQEYPYYSYLESCASDDETTALFCYSG